MLILRDELVGWTTREEILALRGGEDWSSAHLLVDDGKPIASVQDTAPVWTFWVRRFLGETFEVPTWNLVATVKPFSAFQAAVHERVVRVGSRSANRSWDRYLSVFI
jgi:hypothetical protein